MKRYYVAVSLIIIAGVAAIFGSYGVSKPLIEDDQRAADIVRLQGEVGNYFYDHSRLPDSLVSLTLESDLKGRLERYTYSKQSATAYDICTTFNTKARSQPPDSELGNTPYSHRPGYQCFTTTIENAEDQPLY